MIMNSPPSGKAGAGALLALAALLSGNLCTAEALPAVTYGIGQPASVSDIADVAITIMPDGRGLPSGSGSVSAGEGIYVRDCANCHGTGGAGGQVAALAGAGPVSPASLAADKSLPRTIGNYWPYATTLFDYVRRAMPFDRPGSLGDDEVYAVTAYLLYLNDLVGSDSVMDAKTLPRVPMPAQQFFRPDRRGGGAEP